MASNESLNTVKAMRAELTARGVVVPVKARKSDLLALLESSLPDGVDNTTESNTAESAIVGSLSKQARIFLARAESRRHNLYIGSLPDKSADVFAGFKFQTSGESFATWTPGDLLPGYTRLTGLNLESHWLMVAVSLESFVRVVNPLRGNRVTVVRTSASQFMVAVHVRYNESGNRLELVESPDESIWRYTTGKGFFEIDDSAIGKTLPDIDRATLYSAIGRKLRAYIGNNAEVVNDREESRNGQTTLYGLYREARAKK